MNFRKGINTDADGNGTVYQDGTYGYIKTFANTDAAMIVSDAITKAELSGANQDFDSRIQLVTTYIAPMEIAIYPVCHLPIPPQPL